MKQRLNKGLRWRVVLCLVFTVFLAPSGRANGLLPPTIIVQPLGISVQNGDTAVFTMAYLNLVAIPPATVTWQFKGHAISTSSNVVITTSSTNLLVGGVLQLLPVSILTIKNATNGGDYSVVVKNLVGSTTSDSVTLVVLLNTVSNVLNIVSTGTGMTANGFKIQLSGPAGSNYVIQASTDLKNWIPISTNAASAGSVSYTDVAAKNLPFRYYRALIQ